MMAAKESERVAKATSSALILVMPAVLLATTLSFGQSSGIDRKGSDREHGAGWRAAPTVTFEAKTKIDRRSDSGLEIAGPNGVSRDLVGTERPRASFLDIGRAPVINSRARTLSLGSVRTSRRGSGTSGGPDIITNDTFTNGAGTGLWSNAGNWSAGLPGSSNNVLITGTGSAASVTEDTSASINNMTLNSANSWTLNNNLSLTIGGNSISNAGSMTINSAGNNTELIIGSSAVTLSGGGTLTLSNNANNFVFGAATSDALTNQETIQGSGQLGNGQMTFVNSGSTAIVNANNSANSLTLNADGGTTNTGTLEGSNGGTLVVDGSITNTGGTILATGSNSAVVLNGAAVTGGTLTTTAGGTIFGQNGAASSALLSGLTISSGSAFQIPNNNTTLIQGTITNNGTLTVNSGGNNTFLELNTGQNATLAGTGTVVLSNNANNYVVAASAASQTLTNQQTIQGSGNIGEGQMTLVNSGTINANNVANALTIDAAGSGSGGTTNTGTLEASSGATLFLDGSITNTGGTILATGTNSAAVLNGAAVTGGTLTTTAGGTIFGQAGALLNGLTISTGSAFQVPNNNTTLIQGTITNNGTLTINSGGNNTILELNTGQNATLAGSGMVVLSNNANNFIFAASGAASTLTNQTTIEGSGVIGNSALTLVNSATIDANQSNPLSINPNGGTTNTSTLEATAGGTLILDNSVTNTGGTILATGTGSDVVLNAATIAGGKLTSSSGGVITAQASGTLDGTGTHPVTITKGSTVNIPNNNNFLLAGAIANNGIIDISSAGNNTELRIVGPTVTLSGSGNVTLSDNATNFIFGNSTGTEQLINKETIQGPGGNIGNGFLTITNQGTINATASSHGNTLIVQPGTGGVTNTSLLEATGGGSLELVGGFNNTGGTITSGSGSAVTFSGATITGGMLNGSGSFTSVNSTLNGLTNAATVVVPNNAVTTLAGTINNTASLQLQSAGNNTEFQLSGPVVLTGGGTVTLSDNNFNYIFAPGNGATLENQNNTISGSGNIGNSATQITNDAAGVINATSAKGNSLTINPGTPGATNLGLMEASSGGTLVIDNTLTNTNGTTNGTIEALSGGSVVLNGSTVSGGTLTSVGTGSITAQSSALLDGLAHPLTISSGSVLNVPNNQGVFIQGTITNNGTLNVSSGGNNTILELNTGQNATLTGTGTVVLSNNTANFIFAASGAASTLTNQETIQGAGDIGNNSLTLVNSGTINANQPNALTIAANGGTTNTGLLEATSGATLVLADNVTNTGATITAGAGSGVQVNNGVTVTGGTLNGSGSFTVLGGTLSGLTNASTVVVPNNSAAVLAGTITNTGAIQVNSGGNNTFLEASGAVTLTGGGTLTLSDNNANYIVAASSGSSLVNANNTISGSGNIGNNGMAFTNQATVDATSASGNSLTINPGAPGATNTGTMEASSGGTLVILNTLTNTGGTMTALAGTGTNAGGTVVINGATVTGGTLSTQGTGVNAGVIVAQSNATLNGITYTGTGSLQIPNNTVAFFEGTITNNGAMQLNSAGNNTFLLMSGNVTLNGSGTLTLSNNAANFIEGATGSETLTNNSTIEGAGNIGNTSMGLVNGATGTILANDSNALVINTNTPGFNNKGTVSAAAGSTLQINPNGQPFLNFTNTANGTLTGGTYNATGTIQFGATGTSILADDAHTILNGASAQLINFGGGNLLTPLASIGKGSSFSLQGGANFTTAGNFTNNGTLVVGGGSLFDVHGNLTNISGTTISGGTYNLTGTLKANNASGITTNSANITLTGSGALENQSGVNALTGLATNSFGSSFTINGGANFTTTGAFTNSGTLTVGNTSTFNSAAGNYTNVGTTTVQKGGTFTAAGTLANTGTFANAGTLQVAHAATLDLQGGTYANAGGTILVSGTEILLSGNTISGGTLTSNSGGQFSVQNNPTLNGSTSAVTLSSGSSLGVPNSQTLQAVGTLTNNGTFTLNSTGASTELLLTGNLTLGGTGNLTLSNNAANTITATTATDVLTNSSIIQGSGDIGNGSMGLVNKKTITANQSTPLIIDSSSAGFNNTGTLNVSKADTLQIIGGPFQNLSGTTLTGGTYNITGTLEYNSTSDIAKNAATIALSGSTAKIIDSNSNNALAGLATNAAAGKFTVSGGQTLTDSATAFSNAGTLTVGKSSALTLSPATATYTQTGGTTTADGTLVAGGGMTFSGGSIFGNGGTFNAGTNSLTNSATFNIGDKVMTAGSESVTGAYAQSSTGVLDIDIGGTASGTQFDVLNISGAASLNGTLNLDLINGFVPTLGSTFDIVNYASETGTFSTVNGTGINSSEHFQVAVNSTNVTLDVVSGPSVVKGFGGGMASPSQPNATPEPASLLLLGTGLLVLGGLGRTRSGRKVPKSRS